MRPILDLAEVRREDVAVVGGKGANLGELIRAGLPVPGGFVLTTAAAPAGPVEARAGLAEPIRSALLEAYAALGPDAPVAVRSSATAEDLAEASFAGQQETFLNVRGAEALVAAVQDCWASLWSERAVAYRAQQGVSESGGGQGDAAPRMAVVVQRLVPADAAGVLCTANPTTGRRDEMVLSAAWGLGEAVVGGRVDPDQLVADPAGRLLDRRVADKLVRTELAAAGTQDGPVPEDQRRLSVLTDAEVAELVGLGRRIAEHFGVPQDIEWARADGTLWVLQARPITALPPAEDAPPTDWSVLDPHALYVRASIVEQLPDPLSTLFADLIDGSVTRSLFALLSSLGGAGAVRPGDVGLPTVNGYAYYRYARGAMLRVTLRSGPAFRMLLTGATLRRWRDEAHPRYRAAVTAWVGRPLDGLGVAALLSGVVQLLDAGTAYYTAVQTVIPIAAGSESIFRAYYRAAVRRRTDPPVEVFLLGFGSEPIRAETSLYDLAAWTGTQPELRETLLTTSPAEVVTRSGSDPLWAAWRARLDAHLERFGHAVYNLDFVTPVPTEEPAPLLSTLRYYLEGGGVDPRVRQIASAQRREVATEAVRVRLGPLRRRVFDRLLRSAQTSAPLREDALADIGLAWPQLRRLLRELGDRLVDGDVIDDPADVCWLTRSEIEEPPASARADVARRQARWRGQRRVTPPQLLPEGRWRWMTRWMPAANEDQTGAVITGTGASAGVVTATARVLRGPADFDALRPGEVLVAAITTPAWTPLFARAGAVVTDVGGPLSHSSIVAREYGVPAVLGTAVATRRIVDGQRVRVDGTAGTVTLLD